MGALTPYTRAADSQPDIIIRIRAKTALPFLDIDIAPKVLTLSAGACTRASK
jgi:hypothetical protein